MAFAPRGSKGPSRSPKHSPYRTASASSHTPSSRAKTSLSFDRIQTPSGKVCDDACSVRSSCGSDNRNTFKPSSTSWKGDDLATAGSQTPGTSYALPDAHGNVSGMHLIHEHTSYSQNDDLVTPAQKEGRKFGPSLQPAESITSSQVQGTFGVTTPTRTSIKTVQLSPATCKSLNEVAAQLWIMAYHQQYTPKQEGSPPEHSVEHLTQAALLHIIDAGVQMGLSNTQGKTTAVPQKKLAAVCLAGLFLLIAGLACLHAISVQNSYSSMHYS